MSGITLNAAKEKKEEVRQGNLRENDAGIPDEHRVDYDEVEPISLKGHAESIITFDHIARISINDYGNVGEDESLLDLRQNLEGAGTYGFDVQLTLVGVELAEGQLWTDGAEEYPNYKIIGDPEADSNNYELNEEIVYEDDGETPKGTRVTGIGNLGGNSWDGKRLDEFPTDVVQLSIAGRRAQDVLGALDTAGGWFFDPDGNVVEGLFEPHPKMGDEDYDPDTHGAPRLTGYPELRADMVGEKGAIAFTFGDANSSGNRAKEVTLFEVVEEDGEEVLGDALTPLHPEDDAYAKPTYPRYNGLYWDHDDADIDVDRGEDAQPSDGGGVDEAREALMGDDPSYEDLGSDATEFVDDAGKAMAAKGYDSIEGFDDFEERVETAKAEGTIEVDAGQLAQIIDDKYGNE
jgi:hypothetical protein